MYETAALQDHVRGTLEIVPVCPALNHSMCAVLLVLFPAAFERGGITSTADSTDQLDM